MFPEGTDNIASAGYLYPIGGFRILTTINPDFIHSYRFKPFKGVISKEHRLTACQEVETILAY